MSDRDFIPPRTRVLVVDDSAFMRVTLSRMISCEPDMEVVAAAASGTDALEKIAKLDPDVVTLDISMPGLDGLGTLRCIMNQCPRPVLMVSSATEKDAEATLIALSMGAFDYVPKQLSPASLDIMHIRADLVAKIRAAARTRQLQSDPLADARKGPVSTVLTCDRASASAAEAVAIGVSTGGPKALEQILPRFPRDFSVPILIVQHMPAGFTGPFAQRLNSLCSIAVREARNLESIEAGVAYIAPAGVQMRVKRRASDSEPVICLEQDSGHALHIPSIDILMNSIAEVFRNRSIGVIMTGMGSDGAEGMAAIFRAGGLTIGQDEASCAVYGMPRVCSNLGVLTRIVSLSEIPAQIMRGSRRRRHA